MTDYIKAIAESLDGQDEQEVPTSLESEVASYFESRRPDKALGKNVTSELLHSLSLQLGETPKQQREATPEPFYPTAEASKYAELLRGLKEDEAGDKFAEIQEKDGAPLLTGYANVEEQAAKEGYPVEDYDTENPLVSPDGRKIHGRPNK